jgi:hypothetical protein
MSILLIFMLRWQLSHLNGVSLTTDKSMSDFALSYTANIFILVILYICLWPAQLSYINMEGRKSHANRGPICTLENFQWYEEPCFAGAAF